MDMDSKKEATMYTHGGATEDELTKAPAVKETNVHSVALAEAVSVQKPSIWSKNMLRLYLIMGKDFVQGKYNATGLTYVRHRIPGLHAQRLRLLSHGCHQCYACLPIDFRSFW